MQVQQDMPGALCGEVGEEAVNLIGRKGCGDALHKAFQEVDAQLKTEEGTTSTLLLAERQADGGIALQASNVGDSAALLIDPERYNQKDWEFLGCPGGTTGLQFCSVIRTALGAGFVA